MATPEDLDETVNLVEKTGRRIVAEQGDVRDFERLKEMGQRRCRTRAHRLHPRQRGHPALCRRAGHDISAFVDAVNVMLNGVYFTIEAALPAMLERDDGGAIVITSSTAGLNGLCPRLSVRDPWPAGYQAAKHGVVGLMRYYATSLAEKNIRVNTVHPSLTRICRTPLPVDLSDACSPHVSEAMLYLCGQSGRYVTGITLPVDGGLSVK